jgi:hypothetical protein
MDSKPKGKAKMNGKTSNIVDMEEFVTTKKDPKKFH